MALDRLRSYRRFTDARIALDRAEQSLATIEWLRLRQAHADARDALHRVVQSFPGAIDVSSCCADRREYLVRPDLGRRLRAATALPSGPFDIAIVIADGLSPLAIEHQAPAVLDGLDLSPYTMAPLIFARQARVALGDEIGERMNARLVIVLIGERPGLSAADSLGAYLTFNPRVGRTDAERNCISNIRENGLTPAAAARRIGWLARECLRRGLSGTDLKEDGRLLS